MEKARKGVHDFHFSQLNHINKAGVKKAEAGAKVYGERSRKGKKYSNNNFSNSEKDESSLCTIYEILM